jgi:hypothetical protein
LKKPAEKRLYEAWITTDAGTLTTTVVAVEASSEREAFRLVREQYPDQLCRGVYEVGSED